MDVYPLEALKSVAHALSQAPGGYSFWRIHLYKNDVTPGPTTVIGDLVQADFAGYGSQSIERGTHGDDGAGRGLATFNTVTFTATGPAPANDIYGWYITQEIDGKIVDIRRWPTAPVHIDAAGQFLTVVPRITVKSEF